MSKEQKTMYLRCNIRSKANDLKQYAPIKPSHKRYQELLDGGYLIEEVPGAIVIEKTDEKSAEKIQALEGEIKKRDEKIQALEGDNKKLAEELQKAKQK